MGSWHRCPMVLDCAAEQSPPGVSHRPWMLSPSTVSTGDGCKSDGTCHTNLGVWCGLGPQKIGPSVSKSSRLGLPLGLLRLLARFGSQNSFAAFQGYFTPEREAGLIGGQLDVPTLNIIGTKAHFGRLLVSHWFGCGSKKRSLFWGSLEPKTKTCETRPSNFELHPFLETFLVSRFPSLRSEFGPARTSPRLAAKFAEMVSFCFALVESKESPSLGRYIYIYIHTLVHFAWMLGL